MTATPIPRTVAMTVFGDLEVSTLDRAAGRPGADPDHRRARSPSSRSGSTGSGQRVREEVEKGHQAYVVCPRISGDELEQGEADPTYDDDADGAVAEPTGPPLAAVEEVVAELDRRPARPASGSACLHGRLPPDEKDRTMRAFAAGEIDVLVSTTVIEVGVDVANATTMVLLDADRFGISQLHQLRGRVGRGGLPGLCLLVTPRRPGTRRPRAARRGGRAPPTGSS